MPRIRLTRLTRLVLAALVMLTAFASARGDDWPQWLGPRRDSVWRETGLIDKFPESGPRVLWRAPLRYGYAGPAVAAGRVYVLDFDTDAKIEASFDRSDLHGKERVHCLEAATGKTLWKHEYPCHYRISYAFGPRCTPTVHDGKVYTLGAMGDLACLDADKGTVLWSKDLKKDYVKEAPIWGFAGHPLVHGQKLICLVGGPGSVAVAFDKDTGKEIWRSLTAKESGYCPPMLIEAGGKQQVLFWHGESVNSLDPETGKVYWSVPLEPQYGMAIAAPRQLGDLLYVAGIDNKAVLLRLAADRPAVTEVWRGKPSTAVFPCNSTPFLEDGMIYGNDTRGGYLRGVKLADGARVWETLAATTGKPTNNATVFLVKNGDRFVLMSETGHLILARLTPTAYEEISRAKILDPLTSAFNRLVVWSHPAFADKSVFARNDKEIVRVSLAASARD